MIKINVKCKGISNLWVADPAHNGMISLNLDDVSLSFLSGIEAKDIVLYFGDDMALLKEIDESVIRDYLVSLIRHRSNYEKHKTNL